MLKKMLLLVLLSVSNSYSADAHKASFIQRIKNNPTVSKIAGGMIGCMIAVASMNAVIKQCKDNPEKINVVKAAQHVKGASIFVATFFFGWIFRINLKKWVGHLTGKNRQEVQNGE